MKVPLGLFLYFLYITSSYEHLGMLLHVIPIANEQISLISSIIHPPNSSSVFTPLPKTLPLSVQIDEKEKEEMFRDHFKGSSAWSDMHTNSGIIMKQWQVLCVTTWMKEQNDNERRICLPSAIVNSTFKMVFVFIESLVPIDFNNVDILKCVCWVQGSSSSAIIKKKDAEHNYGRVILGPGEYTIFYLAKYSDYWYFKLERVFKSQAFVYKINDLIAFPNSK